MLESKKPGLLIDIYELLEKNRIGSLVIHFVGDGDYLDILKYRVKQKGLEHGIKFYGAIHDDSKTGEMLFCSDLMVMPGYIGLSLNHAFNFDCPVVTFQQKENGPYHSPEIEYLIHERTGYIIDNHSVEDMYEVIRNYLVNKGLQQQMRMNVRYTIDNVCSIENFMKGFKDAIQYTIQNV